MTLFVTAPAWVRAADLGAAVVALDVRTGQVLALSDPARRAWLALARHGEATAAAAEADLAPADVVALAEKLVDRKVLHRMEEPRPWPAPVNVPPSRASWGAETLPVRLDPSSPQVPADLRVLAFVALAVTLAVRQSGRAGRTFGRLVRLAAWSTRRPGRPATASEAADVVRAVRRAARYWPARTACLEESISAAVLLGLRRRQATWCHGVAADPVQLHAWIEVAGRPIAEPESTDRFTALLRVPADNDREGEHGRA